MSRIVFSERAWSEYVYWQTQDKKTLKRIDDSNRLVYDIKDDLIEVIQCKGHYDD